MLYGLYQSANGADAQARRLEVISNNLANAETASFKRDLALFQVQAQQVDGQTQTPERLQQHPGATHVSGVATIFNDGPLETTEGQFDIAIQGPGFMRFKEGNETLFSRSGKLGINDARELIQVDTGRAVLQSTDLKIIIPAEATRIEFSEDGTVSTVDQNGLRNSIGKIHLVEPSNMNMLLKQGDSTYQLVDGQYADAGPNVRVQQGYIERSSVKPIQEMLAMMDTSRALEANMNLIQQQEQSLGLLLQSVS